MRHQPFQFLDGVPQNEFLGIHDLDHFGDQLIPNRRMQRRQIKKWDFAFFKTWNQRFASGERLVLTGTAGL
jgi:hypothetical protein